MPVLSHRKGQRLGKIHKRGPQWQRGKQGEASDLSPGPGEAGGNRGKVVLRIVRPQQKREKLRDRNGGDSLQSSRQLS